MNQGLPAPTLREATAEDLPRIGELGEAVNRLHHEAWPGLFVPEVAPERRRALWSASLPAAGAAAASGLATILVAEGAAGGEADEATAGVIGFVSIAIIDERSPFFRPMRYARIGTLGVDAARRGQGIGRALMQAAETWALSRGAEELHLNVWAFNQRARAFYDELGYAVRAQTLGKRLVDFPSMP